MFVELTLHWEYVIFDKLYKFLLNLHNFFARNKFAFSFWKFNFLPL